LNSENAAQAVSALGALDERITWVDVSSGGDEDEELSLSKIKAFVTEPEMLMFIFNEDDSLIVPEVQLVLFEVSSPTQNLQQ
jgi:hypothetical protein